MKGQPGGRSLPSALGTVVASWPVLLLRDRGQKGAIAETAASGDTWSDAVCANGKTSS